jgi:hypothetical protein
MEYTWVSLQVYQVNQTGQSVQDFGIPADTLGTAAMIIFWALRPICCADYIQHAHLICKFFFSVLIQLKI